MNLFESILSAFHSITSSKMRTFLTMLGIIIGISSVIMITSIGQGFQNMINDQFSSFGLDVLELYMSSYDTKPGDQLTMEDVEKLSAYKDVKAVSPYSSWSVTEGVFLKNPNETRDLYINGVNEDYFNIQSHNIVYGRSFASQDLQYASNVVIIDENLAQQVYGRADAVGEKFTARLWSGSESFTVIGILESTNNYDVLYNRPSSVYIPHTAYEHIVPWSTSVNYILIQVQDIDTLTETTNNILRLMSIWHENEDTYEVWNISSFLEQSQMIIAIFTYFLAFVAFISLIVGGIGVMNIMLVTVTERTREIGIRKSLGATEAALLFQFLVESILLTSLGGFFGVIFGYLGSVGLSNLVYMFLGEPITPGFSLQIILIAFAISATIGIMSGVFPAFKAAKLDAIEALRYE